MAEDAARQLADESLERLERRFRAIYSQAYREMREKQAKALRRYQNELSERKKALDDTPEARKAHKEWLRGQASNQTWMASMVNSLAESATEANFLAVDAINGTLPDVIAESANYAAFEIDKGIGFDTSFNLVDADTVSRLQMGGEPLLKEVTFPKVDRAKDIRWNRQRFHSAITQGILQGESIPNIARRTKGIYGSNMAAALRAARTATTNAENAGRVSSYERAKDSGIKVRQEWLATLDTRTRTQHREMDGQKVEVGQKFSNGCRFPGDPNGPSEEVWNCRCTLVAAVDGVDQSDAKRWSRLPKGMGYDEWKARKAGAGSGVVDGKDILGTWQRRPDKFDFEIEDVIAAQGFDGKPRVVGADEFDRAVKQANGGEGLIMQRVYTAPDQTTLDSYRDMLYDGKWYIDCSKGGHQYGRGMYTAAESGTEISGRMRDTMTGYGSQAEHAYTETMTLDPRARLIDYHALEDARKLKMDALENADIDEWFRIRQMDAGALAAAMGYDAISVPRRGFAVVLNRTKLIIRSPE